MTRAAWTSLAAGLQRPHKYGARKVHLDGHTFDSKAEARRWLELKALHASGAIGPVTPHPRFVIFSQAGTLIEYVGDFLYTENGETVVEDTKGVRTEVYKMKLKMMLACHPHVAFYEVSKAGRRRLSLVKGRAVTAGAAR